MALTIAEQSQQVKEASAGHLPEAVATVFAGDQEAWRNKGVPSGIVSVGATLADFALVDATGATVTLSSLVATGPAVVVFYRGGWCPFCNLALRAYQKDLLPELPAFNSRLVAISPQTPDESLSTVEKAELEFTVLSDPGSRVARQIGVAFQPADEVLAAQRQLGLDISQVNAEHSTDLPMPTVLIVGADRVVRFVDVHPDYTTRTEVDQVLTALKAL